MSGGILREVLSRGNSKGRELFGEKFSRMGFFVGELYGLVVRIPMKNYKSLHAAVMIYVILVNTHTHTHGDRLLLTDYIVRSAGLTLYVQTMLHLHGYHRGSTE